MKKRNLLIPVKSADELQKILFIQRSCTLVAKNEMLALVIRNRDPEKYILAAKKLLAKYASYPTLTEFAADPKLTNVYKWGATFGVTALVGGLILQEVGALQPEFVPVLLRAFLLLLKELDQPEHKSLVELLIGELKVEHISTWQAERIRLALAGLVETFVAVSAQFGLMTQGKEKAALTPTGKRVLMHLASAARFIDEMNKAHEKFQSKKPKP